MLQKLSFGFYLKYSRNTIKRSRIKRGVASVLCAMAVAFCGTSFGFLKDVSEDFQNNMNHVLDRLLIVTNPNYGGASSYLGDYDGHCPMTKAEETALREIEGIEFFEPLVIFRKLSWNSIDFALPIDINEYDDEKADQADICNVSLENDNGLQEEKVLSSALPDDLRPGDISSGIFDVLSYPSESYMDRRSSFVDDSVTGGGYISSEMAELLGITAEDLNHLTMEIELMVPVCRRDGFILVGVNDEEMTREKYYGDFFSRKKVRFEVRGIISPEWNSINNADYIYLPAEFMMKEIEWMAANRMDEAEECTYLSNYRYGESQGESKIIEWAPNTYYITVKDAQDIERIKSEIVQINPNFALRHEYQNLEASRDAINNTRDVMVYISFAVLGVVLLLMALIYVYLIDKRSCEFAILRANGMTKKEIRRIIYAEMLLQFASVFVLALIFAAGIYLVVGKWMGYALRFDWITLFWVFVTSLISIVLPIVISVLFVNRFEPDRVMRN